MPINTAQVYIKNLLNGLVWPMANVPPLVMNITPPDPNVDAQEPQGYVWPSRGTESRSEHRGGTLPRAISFGAASGLKVIEHHMELFVVWWGQDDDPDSDTLFPGMVDAIMSTLRVSADPTPQLTDPWVPAQVSYLIDVGEDMDYEITVRAITDQRYNRYDALITMTLNEVFPS